MKSRTSSRNSSRSSSESDEEKPVEVVVEEDIGKDKEVASNEQGYYWIGKDYSNSYVADFKDIHEYDKDQFDRDIVPRMPWRDEALVMFGESARDLARHFIQRWNHCKVK